MNRSVIAMWTKAGVLSRNIRYSVLYREVVPVSTRRLASAVARPLSQERRRGHSSSMVKAPVDKSGHAEHFCQ